MLFNAQPNERWMEMESGIENEDKNENERDEVRKKMNDMQRQVKH